MNKGAYGGQLLARIDHSIAQIDAGVVTDSEAFEEEMLAGIPG